MNDLLEMVLDKKLIAMKWGRGIWPLFIIQLIEMIPKVFHVFLKPTTNLYLNPIEHQRNTELIIT